MSLDSLSDSAWTPVESSSPAMRWWNDFLHRGQVHLAIKTGITATVSLWAAWGFCAISHRPDVMASGIWCVLSAMFVLQANLGSTFKAAWLRFLGVGVGSLVGGLANQLLGNGAPSLGFAVAVTVTLCFFMRLRDSFRIASFSTAIVMVLWQSMPETHPWLFSFYRFLDSALGIAIALFVSMVIWPSRAEQNLSAITAKTFSSLAAVCRSLKEGNQEQLESRLQTTSDLIHENRFVLDESRLEFRGRLQEFQRWSSLINRQERMLDRLAMLTKAPPSDSLGQAFSLLEEEFSLLASDYYRQRKHTPEHLVQFAELLDSLSSRVPEEDTESFYGALYALRSLLHEFQ